MFANVNVDVGDEQRYLTLPQTAVDLQPVRRDRVRGHDQVRVRQGAGGGGGENNRGPDARPAKPKAKKGPQEPGDELVVQQRFVTTGPTRGDQVAILKGLEEGDEVVTSGQIKLKNGAPIKIDNTRAAGEQPEPDAAGTVRRRVMNFTDIFIRKPVLAIVVSLLILVLGLRALAEPAGAPVSEDRERGRHVTTAYYGADAQTDRPASSPSRSSRRSRRRRASTTCPRPASAACRRSPRRCA